MTELSIDEIHAVTLENLKVLDGVTKELGIRYFLGFGTLLGAVRHGGFIPWDDDLDVLILRDDYEKLLSYFKEHEKELYPYKMFTNRDNPDYPHMIARLCDLRYPIEVENEKPCGMCLFVDIYPIDGLGKSRKKWERMLRLRQQIIAASYYATRIHFEIPKKRYRTPDKYLLYLYAKHKGKDFFLNKLEQYRYRFSWEDSIYAGCAVWDNMVFKKEWFHDALRVPFEDMEVLIPGGYDEMLRESYDNYMELPPEEKRHPQHNYKAYKRGGS